MPLFGHIGGQAQGHIDDDDNDEFEEGDDLCPTHTSSSPPALPPKRSVRKPASLPHSSQISGGDRIIPIVKEVDGSIVVCKRSGPNKGSHNLSSSFNQHLNKSDKMSESVTQPCTLLSEGEGNDQSAASSNASATTSSSGLGTSTTGDQLSLTFDEDPTKNKYVRNSIKYYNMLWIELYNINIKRCVYSSKHCFFYIIGKLDQFLLQPQSYQQILSCKNQLFIQKTLRPDTARTKNNLVIILIKMLKVRHMIVHIFSLSLLILETFIYDHNIIIQLVANCHL